MRRHFTIAVAAALTIAMSGAAFAASATRHNNILNNNADDTTFDLGVDVSSVPITPQGVDNFVAQLDPTGQQIIIDSCRHYVSTPGSVQSQTTIEFCDMLLSG